jgi:hypothetical protein
MPDLGAVSLRELEMQVREDLCAVVVVGNQRCDRRPDFARPAVVDRMQVRLPSLSASRHSR